MVLLHFAAMVVAAAAAAHSGKQAAAAPHDPWRLPCKTASDCALNGLCTNGLCVCDPPWKNFNSSHGPCTMLDMLPVPTTACGPGWYVILPPAFHQQLQCVRLL
jgi:hypothetical protein